MPDLFNRAKMTTTTTGTGTITLGSALPGFQSFAAAGVTDGDQVRYVIEDGTQWEIGTGTYTAAGALLSRSVEESSNSDAAIGLSGSAVVFIAAAAADFAPRLRRLERREMTGNAAELFNWYDDAPEASKVVLVLTNVKPSVDGADLQMRIAPASAPTTPDSAAGNYRWTYQEIKAAAAVSSAALDTKIDLTGAVGNVEFDEDGISGDVAFYADWEDIGSQYFIWELAYMDNAATISGSNGRGLRRNGGLYAALQLFFDSGNLASGFVELWVWE